MSYITGFLNEIVDRLNYSIHHMDVTQWAILGLLAVATGFIALKTKI